MAHCAVALIPAPTPCLPDDAHLTVVYAGEDPNTGVVHTLEQLAELLSMRVEPFAAQTLGVNYGFGENHDEPVILIGLTPELASLRSIFGRFNQSEYQEFRPHVAVPDIGKFTSQHGKIPRYLYFNKIAVWYGHFNGPEWWLGTNQRSPSRRVDGSNQTYSEWLSSIQAPQKVAEQ